jgi:Arf-GAP/coiled-coil/ANK repeat/PH domain-containing protein
MDESNGAILFIEKPKPSDAFSIKERYIQTKVSSSIPFIFDQPTDGFSTINILPIMHLFSDVTEKYSLSL